MLRQHRKQPWEPEELQPAAEAARVQRFPCPGCGADMVWEPAKSCLVCPYCGREEAAPAAGGAVVERPYDEFLQPRPEQMRRLAESAIEVTCSGCGSTVTFTPPDVAGDCPFCGAKLVAQPRAADPLVAPEGVLPFTVPKRDATAAIQKWLQSRWFAPGALKRQARQDALGGVYLPFWTYDADTTSRYTGQRGDHYWETEHYTETNAQGQTERKTRQVRKTRWRGASGIVSRAFDDILIAATRSLPRPRLDALEPWDLAQLRPYDPSFLSGFKAQRYQVGLAEGFEGAKRAMAPSIESDVRHDIGGDEQRIHDIDTSYRRVTFKHLLLPVWISAYRYDKRVYQVMVNARTGEVQGDRPYSFWKIFLLALTILALIATVYLVSSAQQSGYVPSSEFTAPSSSYVAPPPPPSVAPSAEPVRLLASPVRTPASPPGPRKNSALPAQKKPANKAKPNQKAAALKKAISP